MLNKHDIGRGSIPLKLSRPYFRLIIGAMQRGMQEARQGRKEVRVGVRAGPMLSSPADDPLPCTITRFTHNAAFSLDLSYD